MTSPLSFSLGLLGALCAILALALLCHWAYRCAQRRAAALLWQTVGSARGLEAIGFRRRLVVVLPPEEGEAA